MLEYKYVYTHMQIDNISFSEKLNLLISNSEYLF